MLVLAVAHSIFARSMDVMTRDAAEDVTFSPIDKSEWRITARVRAEYTSAFRLVGEAVQATGVGRMPNDRLGWFCDCPLLSHSDLETARDAGWAVTASQIADAREHGRRRVEFSPGRFAVEEVPSDGTALLPMKWVLLGLGAACAVLIGTGRRSTS